MKQWTDKCPLDFRTFVPQVERCWHEVDERTWREEMAKEGEEMMMTVCGRKEGWRRREILVADEASATGHNGLMRGWGEMVQTDRQANRE